MTERSDAARIVTELHGARVRGDLRAPMMIRLFLLRNYRLSSLVFESPQVVAHWRADIERPFGSGISK